MKYFTVVMFLLAMVLISSADAADTNRHSSLYMDVTVHTVDGNNVTFINDVGDVFNFTDVTKSFKVGERTTLEFMVDFSGDTFKVVNAFYVVNDTRFTYPTDKPDEWKMFVGLGGIMLAMLFGGYLLGIHNRQNRKVRR